MKDFQFLNFKSTVELDQPVYRIMKQDHVISLFKNKQNAMSKFGNWKDKFENFLMNCGHETNDVKHDNTVREMMVAQCWTKDKYSEAMWGIYANDPNERFLRIRSTPRKLLSELNSAQPEQANALIRVGSVEYKSTPKIKEYYEVVKEKEVTQELLFESLLIKRRAFSHEREVRLMYCAMFGSPDEKGLFWYSVDPQKMITQIMADPNRSRTNWNTEKARIQSQTRFCGEIKRSKIYDAPAW